MLSADDTFYSVMRQRVAQHLIRVGSPTGGPTAQCIDSASDVLRDCGTNEPAAFFGGFPRDKHCSIPERHLGLHMPDETEEAKVEASRRFDRLVALMEENLDLDGILELGRTCSMPMPSLHGHSQLPMAVPTYSGSATTTQNRCRIGIADDAAFCFYYADNLHLLKEAGAELHCRKFIVV